MANWPYISTNETETDMTASIATSTSRIDAIMARVDAWADEHAGWDCRAEALDAAEYCLALCPEMTDDEVVDDAILSWTMAE